MPPRLSAVLFTLLFFLSTAHSRRPYLFVITNDDLKDPPADSAADKAPSSDDSADWDEFGDPDASVSDDDHDPGSWRPIFESQISNNSSSTPEYDADQDHHQSLYFSGVRNMISAASSGSASAMEDAAAEIEAAASAGHPHAQSALGFLYGAGTARPQSRPKSFLYHHFAVDGGNMQSKMVLAYTYFRLDMFEKAVQLYAELAEVALASFLISKEPPVIEPIRIHSGTEENKEALRKSRGEDNEDCQMTEYQAVKGNVLYICKIGVLYCYGLRGLRRDHGKPLYWFSKSAEKGEPKAMEFLGEIYERGAGVERNYTKALQWIRFAAERNHFSAYNGLGYLYVKGYGVEKRNFTKAKEYFERAAENNDFGGNYNLGVLYLKGIGVRTDVALACKYFF